MSNNEKTTGEPINARIAERVRGLRGALGISLDALSARCEVSRSMLSLVERGGRVRSQRVASVAAKTLRPILVGQIDAATKTFINRFLGFAKAEYGMIYDEIVREFEKVKKVA